MNTVRAAAASNANFYLSATPPQESSHLPENKESLSFQEQESKRDEMLHEFSDAYTLHQEAKGLHERTVEKAILREQSTIRQIMGLMNTCLPPKNPPSHQQVALAAEKVASSYDELAEALSSLEYQDPEEVLNQSTYSEERLSLGSESYPNSGEFIFGRALRDQLKANQEHHLLQILDPQSISKEEETIFAEMGRDLPRATFMIQQRNIDPEEPPSVELLFDHRQKEEEITRYFEEEKKEPESRKESSLGKNIADHVTDHLVARGIGTFKDYIGPSRALQIAIGSLMYQRGAADLEYMQYGVSRNPQQELQSFFTDGLKSIRPLEHESRLRPGTRSEKTIVYYLEKKTGSHDQDVFDLTIFNAKSEERIHVLEKQEFTLHTADFLKYRFQENEAFDPHRAVALDHLPVHIDCLDGKITHRLIPFQGERPPLPDTISLSHWESLSEEEQQAVHDYHQAEQAYLHAKERSKSTMMHLASRPQFGPLISSQRLEKEETITHELQLLRNTLQEKATRLAGNRRIAPFLDRNMTIVSDDQVTLSTEGKSALHLPANLSFEGSRSLQYQLTKQLEKQFLEHSRHYVHSESLSLTAEKLNFEDGQTLLSFSENSEVAKGIDLLIAQSLSMVIPLLQREPLFGEMISSLSNETASFSLEKRSHPSSEDPFFILEATYQAEQSYPTPPQEQATLPLSRQMRLSCKYALRVNRSYDSTELNSLENLSLEIRCIGIHVDQNIQSIPPLEQNRG